MLSSSRRRFLADVGKGMLVASVGTSLAIDLGLAPVMAGEAAAKLEFGELEPLAAFMQETPPDKMLPSVVEKLKSGLDLRTLVAAASLANARTFGGQDYVGYHSFMALAPAYAMAAELSETECALPILKVLYRNSSRMQAVGGRRNEALHPIEAATLPADAHGGEVLRDATRSGDRKNAERTFAAIAKAPPGEAFNHLQYAVEDEADVHRVVLAWRAWAALDLTGESHAHTLLRQSVIYCVDAEQRSRSRGQSASPIRALLPKLFDQYHLLDATSSQRRADDGWMLAMSRLIAGASPEQAADAVAAALAEGMASGDVGEAIALAANELVLRDPGRAANNASREKPAGSVHGDSVGVHASDAANAWRNIALVSNERNRVASLIVGAFHTAGRHGRLNAELFPTSEHLQQVKVEEADALVQELQSAVTSKDQFRAVAIVHRYGQLGHEPRKVFDALLRFAISEDGALHAEKYYHTVSQEFANTRPAFRWRHLTALARVTASEYGLPAPGHAQARELLGL